MFVVRDIYYSTVGFSTFVVHTVYDYIHVSTS